MPSVSQHVEESLRAIVGDRIRTDRVERRLYSADIGEMPKLVKPFVPAGLAGAVVRPTTEDEVVALVKLAARDGLKLVPRGASTSGYGGVLPVEGAVVVDLSGMHGVLDVDVAGRKVRVQPGLIWEELQRKLEPLGLALRLYPSSTPSSSVAGWLAQGGAGFGSYEYGMFKDNVESARVVLPTGDVRTFTGRDLARYVADAEGITGIITEVTVLLRDLEPETHRLFAFDDARAMHAAFAHVGRVGNLESKGVCAGEGWGPGAEGGTGAVRGSGEVDTAAIRRRASGGRRSAGASHSQERPHLSSSRSSLGSNGSISSRLTVGPSRVSSQSRA